jgi:hypothetical protein
MPSDFGLTVRRHERHLLSLSALVGVASNPVPAIGVEGFVGGRLRFSPESGVSDSGGPAKVVDLGAGGVGFTSTNFLPRGALLRVRILGEGGSHAKLRLDATVRVQRVTMTDRKPTYLYGTSFVDTSPTLLDEVNDLIAKTAPKPLNASSHAVAGGVGGAGGAGGSAPC